MRRRILIAVVMFSAVAIVGFVLKARLSQVQLGLTNIILPLITLVMLWAIWARQRRIEATTQAKIEEAASLIARLLVLSDALERDLKCHSATRRGSHADVDLTDANVSSITRPRFH